MKPVIGSMNASTTRKLPIRMPSGTANTEASRKPEQDHGQARADVAEQDAALEALPAGEQDQVRRRQEVGAHDAAVGQPAPEAEHQHAGQDAEAGMERAGDLGLGREDAGHRSSAPAHRWPYRRVAVRRPAAGSTGGPGGGFVLRAIAPALERATSGSSAARDLCRPRRRRPPAVPSPPSTPGRKSAGSAARRTGNELLTAPPLTLASDGPCDRGIPPPRTAGARSPRIALDHRGATRQASMVDEGLRGDGRSRRDPAGRAIAGRRWRRAVIEPAGSKAIPGNATTVIAKLADPEHAAMLAAGDRQACAQQIPSHRRRHRAGGARGARRQPAGAPGRSALGPRPGAGTRPSVTG